MIFYLFAATAILSGLMVVTVARIFHCALWLACCLVSVAGIFFFLDAEFIGAAQLLIYAVGVTMLMIFAIMFTQRLGGVEPEHVVRAAWAPLLVAGMILGIFLVSFLEPGLVFQTPEALPAAGHATPGMGKELLRTYAVPFEIASVYLVAAMVGAIVLARREES